MITDVQRMLMIKQETEDNIEGNELTMLAANPVAPPTNMGKHA